MATEVTISQEDLQQATQVRERIPEPGVVVIFGASGDLTKRKLLPALFHLQQAGLLPEEFAIVGVARRHLENEFPADMKDGILKFGGVSADASVDEFVKKVSYFALDFDNSDGYAKLKTYLEKIDKERGTRGNRLYYLATAPEYFADIISRLGEQKLAQPERGTVRAIIEKPFGHDLLSARQLNDEVNKVFHESQIFRIDHYLGKETVQNVLVFRFANGIFEPIWNRTHLSLSNHRRREHRHRGPWALLRKGGRAARRGAEPHDGAAVVHCHGAAGIV
jgi:glucose-6-phosphate 1-dehydrogenase